MRPASSAKPFLKWAGGKSQLINTISEYLPTSLLKNEIDTYVEPFIGGGALFFYIAERFKKIDKFYLFDFNTELVNTYNVIKDSPKELIELLNHYQNKYNELEETKKSELFYSIRDNYNNSSNNPKNTNDTKILKAAELIFLNKTCFNGLYRVNSKNKFNVPFGRYKNPKIVDENNIMACSKILQKAIISNNDFADSVKYITQSTFVYLDPPYRPLNITSSFNSYSSNSFDDNEQIRLSKFYEQISNLKAKVMLSNSDPKNSDENDHFFDELYVKYYIYRVEASRMINSNSAKRGKINEILVLNYNPEEK